MRLFKTEHFRRKLHLFRVQCTLGFQHLTTRVKFEDPLYAQCQCPAHFFMLKFQMAFQLYESNHHNAKA